MENTPFLSIKEAADYLQVDYKVVYRLVKEGRLRATRVGWQFRITPTDIEAYLQSQVIGDIDSTLDEDAVDGERHRPTRRREMGVRLPSIGPCIPMRIDDAKTLETYVCDAFVRQVSEIDSFQHPVSGKLVHVRDWSALYDMDDERTRLLDILDTAFLDRKTLATTPLNNHIRYFVGDSLPLSVELKFLGHLDVLSTTHEDSGPATRNDLLRFLEDTAPQEPWIRVIGCVSPTGWDELAIACAHDQNWLESTSLLLFLIDACTGEIFYNEQSKTTRRFAGLFGFVDAFRSADESM